MIVDYRKRWTKHAPILIDRAVVEQVESFKFLGVHITNEPTWPKYTKTVVKRAQQNLFPNKRLKRFGMGPQIFNRFYSCTIENILTGCITDWYGNCLAPDRKELQRGPLYQVMSEANRLIDCSLWLPRLFAFSFLLFIIHA